MKTDQALGWGGAAYVIAGISEAPVILLGYPASLDVENEMEDSNSINKLIENKTVIIVSHRMKSIEKADKIVVMDDGKLLVLESEEPTRTRALWRFG